jgi:magnesium-transporting ATPase (P-type)
MKGEEIPADMLCISAPKEVVFISTMNLDGETNLKDRELAIPKLAGDNGIQALQHFNGFIGCDAPNELLENWNSVLKFDLD